MTPVIGPATNAPPLMDIAAQPALHVAVALLKPPPSVTVLLEMVELVLAPTPSLNVMVFTTPVVTCQGAVTTVLPIVTLAVVMVLPVADEVWRIAMVLPLLTPETGPATNPAPLMEIPVQPVPQVAVELANPPDNVTVSLVIVEPMATLV